MSRWAVLVLVLSGAGWARVVRVTTVNELRSAIELAQAGDVITVAAGTYTVTSKLSASAAGTASSPIVVQAEQPLQARLESNTLIAIGVSGPFWRFRGLWLRGVCAVDSSCEHAFQVTGAATDVVLEDLRLQDFNAQLKVNASFLADGGAVMPHRGTVQRCEVFDTRPRDTNNPVTKLNIDTGDDWVVRENDIHDFVKAPGGVGGVSYGSFMKSGGQRGLYERNLVRCRLTVPAVTGEARLGLSFGGGGTAPQFCFPGFNAAVPCSVEHQDGVMRNNIITACSDVGVYINRGRNSSVLFNTLIATSGIDYRFDTTSGLAAGNLLAGVLRTRDAAQLTQRGNRVNVAPADFAAWYQRPLEGDLRVLGDVTALQGAGPGDAGVVDDYCRRARPGTGGLTLGALEHTLGTCNTLLPFDAGMAGDAGAPGGDAGSIDGGAADAGPDAGRGFDAGAGDGGVPATEGAERVTGGCACGGPPTASWPGFFAGVGALALLRRRSLRALAEGALDHPKSKNPPYLCRPHRQIASRLPDVVHHLVHRVRPERHVERHPRGLGRQPLQHPQRRGANLQRRRPIQRVPAQRVEAPGGLQRFGRSRLCRGMKRPRGGGT